MAVDEIGDLALLAIRPIHVEKLVSGVKQWEFRKTRFRRNVTHIAIYTCSPISMVVGLAQVIEVIEASPESVWRRCRGASGLQKHEFFDYYSDSDSAVAIRVGPITTFDRPLGLTDVLPGGSPPQSFVYLSAQAATKLLDRHWSA